MSNIWRVVVCNSGTYHINLILPTKLNDLDLIENSKYFKYVYSQAVIILVMKI